MLRILVFSELSDSQEQEEALLSGEECCKWTFRSEGRCGSQDGLASGWAVGAGVGLKHSNFSSSWGPQLPWGVGVWRGQILSRHKGRREVGKKKKRKTTTSKTKIKRQMTSWKIHFKAKIYHFLHRVFTKINW